MSCVLPSWLGTRPGFAFPWKKRVAALCLPFLPRARSIQILPPGKPGTPPCKSGQLEKDLGLEASSARHAARLIISEIMRVVALLSCFDGVENAPCGGLVEY